jgi:hypothetical protein
VACAGDARLRPEVEALLGLEAEQFVERPASHLKRHAPDSARHGESRNGRR